MPRIRSIHYDACKSEKLDAASAEAERCYWRLAPHCDDAGRAEDDPRLLRSAMFPLSDTITAPMVDGWLLELAGLGLIVRYDVGGAHVLEVTRWSDYQNPRHPSPSKLPAPPEDYTPPTADCRKPPEDRAKAPHGEGEGEGEGEGGVVALKRDGPVELVFIAWQESTGHHKAVLDSKRRGVIVKALKHYPLEDLTDACRGVLMVAHNRGETNGTRYDALELVLRDSEHIERFRDQFRSGPAPPKGAGGLMRAISNGAIDVGS